jgi:uncharacterized YigZ family protein
METLAAVSTYEQDIKKSVFRAFAGPVSTEQDAKAFIASHGDASANHNCWAWKIGATYRFSDDGEPSGTAGKPILQVIEGQGLDHVVVVVTRWFGGTLLGAGGLVRAYGGTAAACLRTAERKRVIATIEGRLLCAFADLALVKSRLKLIADLTIAGEEFLAEGVALCLAVPLERQDEVGRLLSDLTAGRLKVIWPD